MAAKPKAFPKSLGACADLLFDMREKRLAADKVAAELKAEESRLKEHIINTLDKDSGGAVGKHHKVVVITKMKPQVKDWDKFYAYVKRTGAFDLFQRRLGEQAAMDRTTFGTRVDPTNEGALITYVKKTVPGVEIFNAVDVSLTKVK